MSDRKLSERLKKRLTQYHETDRDKYEKYIEKEDKQLIKDLKFLERRLEAAEKWRIGFCEHRCDRVDSGCRDPACYIHQLESALREPDQTDGNKKGGE